MDDEIRHILYKASENTCFSDLKGILKVISDSAGDCNRDLYRIACIEKYREREKKAKKKPISHETLLTRVRREIFFDPDNMKYPGDLFYFPGQIGPDSYYDDTMAMKYLQEMLEPSFMLKGNPQEFNVYALKYRCYILALKKAFHVLAQEETFPVSPYVLYLLWERFTYIHKETRILWDTFCKKDIQVERNKKNASSTSPKIERIKKHSSYSEINEILGRYTGSLEQRNKIDRILNKVTGISNAKTLRKYRGILIKDFRSKNQTIN